MIMANNDDFLKADPDTQTNMVLKEFKAAYQLLETGGLNEHAGQFAAFLNEHLVGIGSDSVELRKRVSEEQHVHPKRLAVIHILSEVAL